MKTFASFYLGGWLLLIAYIAKTRTDEGALLVGAIAMLVHGAIGWLAAKGAASRGGDGESVTFRNPPPKGSLITIQYPSGATESFQTTGGRIEMIPNEEADDFEEAKRRG